MGYLGVIKFPTSYPVADPTMILDPNPTQGSVGVIDDQDSASVVDKILKIQLLAQTFKTSLMNQGLSVQNFSQSTVYSSWAENYPYRFIILKTQPRSSSGPQEISYDIVSSFRLPINPQQLSISSPFATRVTVTSNGILEESNGIPLKSIVIEGTTGVFITREKNEVNGAQDISILGTLFGGTIDAASSFINSVKSSISQFSNVGTSTGTESTSSASDALLQSTGYYQYNMLRMFLESYAELKKAASGGDYRLAFQMEKDRQIYLVAIGTMVHRKSAASPNEYLYTIPMTAWASISPGFRSAAVKESSIDSLARNLRTTRRLFNALRDLRKTTSAFKNIISSARADVESNIFGPVNDVILFTKDLLSIPRTIADFPKSLRDSLQTSVFANWDALRARYPDLNSQFNSNVQSIKNQTSGSNQNGVSYNPFLASNPQGNQDIYNSSVFDDLVLTDTVEINSLPLSDAQQQAIDSYTEKSLSINQNNLDNLITELNNLSDTLAPTIAGASPTDEEWGILYSLADTIESIIAFTADGGTRNSVNRTAEAGFSSKRAVDALSFWTEFAAENDVNFIKPQAKLAIPFPFRSTLQEIAYRYMGDPTRWMEIAALNGLQAPYIDEDGFSYSFLNNGSKSSFNVNSNQNIFVGQSVFLYTNTINMNKRKILAINEISNTNFQIIVDGVADLAIYKTANVAKMKAFLPYTTNSMKEIFIPVSGTPGEDDVSTTPITFLQDTEEMIKFSKIDFLLDENYDLAVTSDNFVNLAYGKANLLQAARLKMATVTGANMLHSSYGGGTEVGTSVADLDIDTIISNTNTSFQNDPRFNAPSSITFNLDGNSLSMSVVAALRNSGGILPITVPLTR